MESLTLEQVAFSPSGSTLTLKIAPGQSMVVVGPAASGKSRLLRAIAGYEEPKRGRVLRPARVAVAGANFGRRAKPQSIARDDSGDASADRVAQVLNATKLWDCRSQSLSDLSPSQLAACELIVPLTADAEMIVIDAQLDRLDPWTLRSTVDLLLERQARGAIVVVSTQRPDLVGKFDALVALQHGNVRFAGTVSDLLRSGPPQHLEVLSENRPGVRALVEPFEVSMRETEDGLVMQASEGQQLAAKLLLEGYGDVKLVVLRSPTLEEALLGLF